MNIEVKTGVYTFNDEDFPFSFYTSLTAYKKAQFVASVSDILVGDNYNYIIKDLVFDYCVVAIFTDVDTSDVQEAADGITAMEEFVHKFKSVVDIVKANVDDGVMDELEKAVALNIEYKTGIHINPISSSLASLLDTIEQKVADIDLDDLMGAARAMSGISGEFTPEKIIDAYAKTDIFKKNWENAEADKVETNAANDGGESVKSPTTPQILSPAF